MGPRRFEEISELNRELLKMVDFTSHLWNGGARYWLEHRGPNWARALADARGLKLWFLSPSIGNIEYALKVCSLFADHVVVGNGGALPPYHFGLAFPWRLDDSTEIPPAPHSHGVPIVYPLRVDAVRRPLPPVAKQCLLGPLRPAVELGIVSYFPASVIYAPLPGQRWPSPAEILSREGQLPRGHRLLGVKKEPGKEPPRPRGQAEVGWTQSEQTRSLQWTIGDQGFPESDDPRIPKTWQWSGPAIQWEILFSSLVASGGVEISSDHAVSVSRLPDGVFRLRLPYLQDADWETIHRVREAEGDALDALRASVLEACSSIQGDRDSRAFGNAVADIQERVIDKGVGEIDKSFRALRGRQWVKAAALVVGTVTLEIACFLGLPVTGALLAGGAALGGALHLAADFEKEEEEWPRRGSELPPMYFLWRLGHGA